MPTRSQRQRVAVYGVARRDGNVLLARAAPRSGAPGTWWLPGGGLRFGESPSECLAREFREETGLGIRPHELIDVISDVTEMVSEPVRLNSVRLVYEVEVAPGNLRSETDGSTDGAAWVSARDLGGLNLMPWLAGFAARHLIGP